MKLIECKITAVVVVVVAVVVVVTVVVVVVVVLFLSVTPSTKSTKFGSRYLVDGLSEREEIWRNDTEGLAMQGRI